MGLVRDTDVPKMFYVENPVPVAVGRRGAESAPAGVPVRGNEGAERRSTRDCEDRSHPPGVGAVLRTGHGTPRPGRHEPAVRFVTTFRLPRTL